MATLVRIADNKGRISLPGFANATVILEAISPNEFRVRKAEVIPKDELRFPEEDMPLVLSERDAQSPQYQHEKRQHAKESHQRAVHT